VDRGEGQEGYPGCAVASEVACSHPTDSIFLGFFDQSLRRNTQSLLNAGPIALIVFHFEVTFQ